MAWKYLSPIFVLFIAISIGDCAPDVIDMTHDLLTNVTTTLKLCQAESAYLSETLGICQAEKLYARTNQTRCEQLEPLPQDCADLFKSGYRRSGAYSILPLGYQNPFFVYCDMTTAGGGWTVFQRRGDYGNPEDFFFKTWAEYKVGFGNLRKEFWLGNDRISALTQQGANILRIDLTKMDGDRVHALYNKFWMDKESNQYTLYVSGYTGTAGGDSMAYHTAKKFFTKDKDNANKCSEKSKGGWWYDNCLHANLNGLNLKGINTRSHEGITWHHYSAQVYSLYSEMKVRPAGF